MQLHAIPAFVDNYLWTLVDDDCAVAVDPGYARPIRAFLDRYVQHAQTPVYGPREEASAIPGITLRWWRASRPRFSASDSR